ncbi:helix-turn-helix transcriptional regulator [bacterium]|nr:helix-turn-helix transcriptional regulator [bacterium]
MKGIGHKIRAARFTRGKEWTQKKLADAAGLSQGYISAIERGDEFPSLKALKRIGEVLDCSLGYFIEEESELDAPITESKYARRTNQDDTLESVKSNIAAIFKEMLQDQHANNKNSNLKQMQEDIVVLKKKVASLETNLKKKR